MGPKIVLGAIINKLLIGIIIPEAMVIACTVNNNVLVIQIAVPLNAEIAIAAGGKLGNALQSSSELFH